MISPGSLRYLLLLPLATCFPLLAREGPVDDAGGIRGETSWAGLAGGHHSPWRSSPWGSPRWQHRPLPQALPAAEPRAVGTERAGGRPRAGLQDHGGSEATGFRPAGGLLGSLAEELTSYSRKKGGFSFRFGRR
ncbi:Orexigenic neuropeptide QRFP [Galemys pyrenaicus]|uniref:Orexigenic neuropeptide QRFP n=1 Tax=Galemys pyrenaicus TaxID=202257 RepID=A0A8J6DKF6_GALPY|nr:Orexigenic neuropeptide QRFP [Galemys pyrenaicus]